MRWAIRHLWTLAACTTVLLGCAIAPSGPPGPPVLRETPEGSAEVYIFNDSGWTLIPSNQDVMTSGELIASLPRGTYTRVFVRPGAHELQLHNRRLKLDTAEGQTYYVVVGYRPERSWAFPFAGDPVVIKQISQEEARGLMGEMKPQ